MVNGGESPLFIMKQKKDLEQEINDFLDIWHADELNSFFRHIIPLFQLYNVDDENDWVREAVGEEDTRAVRIVQTVYLLSRIAEFHAGRFAETKLTHKKLYERMEKEGIIETEYAPFV